MAGVQCLRFRALSSGFSIGRISSSTSFYAANKTNYLITSQRCIHQDNLKGRVVRIGCASGFWGDTAVAAPQLIYQGKVNYVVFDYLSEITMSLLVAAKRKVPEMGYAPDFVHAAVAPYVKDLKSRGVKMVANAGGINPAGCAAAIRQVCEKAGVDLKIACVTGDDMMAQVEELRSLGIADMDSGMTFPKQLHSMNAYLGAGPIAKALDMGADIVVTGRCADSALVLGPLIHEFGWKMDQFDALAQGSLAGHLVECGAQATGGIFTDWDKVKNWDTIGFPIVSVGEDGNFTLSKPPKTGGMVNVATVSEQMLYEIGDPKHYFLPDVVCDFSNVSIKEVNSDTVLVAGAKGSPPSGNYKVSATHAAGYRTTAAAVVCGPRATEKAEKTADAILNRSRRIFKQLKLADFSGVNIEVIGGDRRPLEERDCGTLNEPKNGVLWMAVNHAEKKALQLFSMEIAAAGTGMAPGLTGIVGGRPKISPILKLFSFLHAQDNLKIKVEVDGETVDYEQPQVPTADYPTQGQSAGVKATEVDLPVGDVSYRLKDLAYTRSGDKGDSCNIGVVARHPSYLPFIRQQLTEQAVHKYFEDKFEDPADLSKIVRYDVPGVNGLNFVLKNSLGGGGIASLRSDPQGKGYGQDLLNFRITGVPDLKKMAQE